MVASLIQFTDIRRESAVFLQKGLSLIQTQLAANSQQLTTIHNVNF